LVGFSLKILRSAVRVPLNASVKGINVADNISDGSMPKIPTHPGVKGVQPCVGEVTLPQISVLSRKKD